MRLKLVYIFLIIIIVTFLYCLPTVQAVTLSSAFYHTFLPFPSNFTNVTTTITNTTAYFYWFLITIPINETTAFFSLFKHDPLDFYNPYFIYFGIQFDDKNTHFITKYYLSYKTKEFSSFYEGLGFYIKYDFYPNFFLLGSIEVPLYLENIFTLQNILPTLNTSETIKLYSEIGVYLYQIELFFSINTINTKYYKSNSTTDFDEFVSSEYALNLRLVPTFTQLGYDIKVYYRSNYYTFSTLEQRYNNIIAAQGAVMANIFDNFMIRLYFGYLLWVFTSSTITLDPNANKILLGLEIHYTIK